MYQLDSIPLEKGAHSTLRILAQDEAGFGVPNVRLRLTTYDHVVEALGTTSNDTRLTSCARDKALVNATGDLTDVIFFETGVGGVAAVNVTPSWSDCFYDEATGRGRLVLFVIAEEWIGRNLAYLHESDYPVGQPALIAHYWVRIVPAFDSSRLDGMLLADALVFTSRLAYTFAALSPSYNGPQRIVPATRSLSSSRRRFLPIR